MQSADAPMTWEQAVLWLQSRPEQQALVKACFFDDPLLGAASRYYASTEWQAVRQLLSSAGGTALDIGSGRGISAFSLAKDGWATTALEPNPSPVVGAGAIRQLSNDAHLQIKVIETWGEALPFEGDCFDLVHVRQALHHAHDLRQLCREIARVLKPGGMLIATREHVISRRSDLVRFLDAHPLQRLYGGEQAFLLEEYLNAISDAGMRVNRVLNPLESDINLYPETLSSIKKTLARKLHLPANLPVPDKLLSWIGRRSNVPGRLYTFLGIKTAPV